MAVLYITEFSDVGMVMPTLAVQPPLASQAVTFTATSTVSAAFNAATRLVRLHTDTVGFVKFTSAAGADPVAVTVTDMRMAASQTEYFLVPKGQNWKVAAVT